MSLTRPSSDLQNKYNEISEYCDKHNQPIFITNNGQDDLVVMSMEAYKKLIGRFELFELLDDGIEAMQKGKIRPFTEVIADLQNDL